MSLVYLAWIAAFWLAGWRWGVRWCHLCGINGRLDRMLLGWILPGAGLVLAVHLLALCALISGQPVVTLGATTILFTILLTIAGWFIGKQRSLVPWSNQGAPGPVVEVRWLDEENCQNHRSMYWPIAVVAATYAFFFLESLTRYPAGYDGLYYHLPTAVQWGRSGRLDLVFGDLLHSLPENAMIVPFLLAAPGWERAISLFNLPQGLILIGCVYALARTIGAGCIGATAAAGVAASVPIVLFQTFSSYVDLYGAAAWMSALLALAWSSRMHDPRARRRLLMLAGLAAGIALGSKSTYLIHVALLLPIAAWIGYTKITNYELQMTESRDAKRTSHEQTKIQLSHGFRAATIFGLAALVCSAFWFVRGTVQAGNPLYPFGLTIGGTEILSGFDAGAHIPARSLARRLTQWLAYPWRETNYAGTGYDFGVNNGLGAVYAALVPAAVLFLLLHRGSADTSDPRRAWLRIFLMLTFCAPPLLMTAFTEVLRYVFPLLLPGIVLTAILVDHLHRGFPQATRRLLTAALTVTCVVAILPPARALAGRVRSGQWSREWQYQVPGAINELAAGSRVLYVGPPDLTYPFMGSGLRHEVIHETVWRARHGSGEVDATVLAAANIDFVILRDPWPADWGDTPPGVLIFDDTDTRALGTTAVTRIYAVRTPSAGAGL